MFERLRLARIGVQADMPAAEVKCVALTNVLALLAVVFISPWAVLNTLLGVWALALAEWAGIALFLVPVALNRAGQTDRATDALMVITVLTTLALTWTVGHRTGVHTYLLTHAVITFFIFPPRRRRAMWIVATLGAAAFTSAPLFTPELPSIDLRLSESAYEVTVVLIRLGAATFLLLCAYYARRENELAEQRVVEAQEALVESEKQAMVGRLVAGILHESNTPLGAITSSADTLGKTLDKVGAVLAERVETDRGGQKLERILDNGRKLVALINESSERIRGVVDDLKRFVSLDEAEVQRFDVRASIKSALGLLRDQLAERVEVDLRLPEAPVLIEADPARVNRMILSLLENASEAIEGEGRLNIDVEQHADAVRIEIADTGRGIPKALLPELFEPGFTHRGGRVKMRLGLPTSRRLARELGGDLTLESEVGVGTRVRLQLPGAP